MQILLILRHILLILKVAPKFLHILKVRLHILRPRLRLFANPRRPIPHFPHFPMKWAKIKKNAEIQVSAVLLYNSSIRLSNACFIQSLIQES